MLRGRYRYHWNSKEGMPIVMAMAIVTAMCMPIGVNLAMLCYTLHWTQLSCLFLDMRMPCSVPYYKMSQITEPMINLTSCGSCGSLMGVKSML